MTFPNFHKVEETKHVNHSCIFCCTIFSEYFKSINIFSLLLSQVSQLLPIPSTWKFRNIAAGRLKHKVPEVILQERKI